MELELKTLSALCTVLLAMAVYCCLITILALNLLKTLSRLLAKDSNPPTIVQSAPAATVSQASSLPLWTTTTTVSCGSGQAKAKDRPPKAKLPAQKPKKKIIKCPHCAQLTEVSAPIRELAKSDQETELIYACGKCRQEFSSLPDQKL